MGELSVVEFVTLDGVVQGFHNVDKRDGFRHSGWGNGYQDESQVQAAVEGMQATAAYLFGRRTYDDMTAFWPFEPDENPMAAHLNRTPKYVVTHGCDDLEWRNARKLDGELDDAVRALKGSTDGYVTVLGSGSVVGQLLAADLVDRFELLVHPLVLGTGRQLFPRTDEPVPLDLQDVGSTSTGVVTLRYNVRR
jgi:dihydrofolate reductase